jgi:hypothetical protein
LVDLKVRVANAIHALDVQEEDLNDVIAESKVTLGLLLKRGYSSKSATALLLTALMDVHFSSVYKKS